MTKDVFEARPVEGDVDFDALMKDVQARISKAREYLAGRDTPPEPEAEPTIPF